MMRLCAAALAVWAAAMAAIAGSPDAAWLGPVEAPWILREEPVALQTWPKGDSFAYFRKRFSVSRVPPRADMTFRFMKDGEVVLDGKDVLAPARELGAWKQPRSADLAPLLSPGDHELLVAVMNRTGQKALSASCPALGLATGPDWEASADRKNWAPAWPAAGAKAAPMSAEFASAGEAFIKVLPVVAVVFFAAAWARPRGPALRWLVLAAGLVFALNNMVKLPAGIGMDVNDHLDYIRYVAEHRRLPLAPEGWQMFQAPLYYLLSAPLYLLFSRLFSSDGVGKALRVVPLACWLGQIELCWRCLKAAFPSEPELQAAGMLVGGLLPFNLYLAQAPGNEPLAGFLSSAAIFLALRVESEPLVLGVALGLALLAKASAFLLLGAAAVFLYWRGTKGIVAMLGAAFAVSGWFYLRNWAALGRPVIGGSWDSLAGQWWQDPGYRTLGDFLRFGQSLRRPIYAGLSGFWDSLYSTFWLDGYLSGITTFRSRPPWNYSFMISGAWLGLVPTAAILAGLTRAFSRRESPRALRFCAACVALYAAALAALYLKLPIYSTGKATYLSGLAPCFALLAAWGLKPLRARRWALAALAAWAAAAYLAYFVI